MRIPAFAALAASLLVPPPGASAATVVLVVHATTVGDAYACSAAAAGGPVLNTWVTCRWLDADGATLAGFTRSAPGPASAVAGNTPMPAGARLCVEARTTTLDGSVMVSTCADTALPGGGMTGTALG